MGVSKIRVERSDMVMIKTVLNKIRKIHIHLLQNFLFNVIVIKDNFLIN